MKEMSLADHSTMLSMHSRFRLFALCCVFLVCACSPQVPSPPPFSTSTNIPLRTSSPPVSTPEMTNIPLPMATQFCMGYVSSWSCTCGDLPREDIQIKTADQAGACEISLPHAYRIRLSDDWYCHTAGAAAINLACVTAYGGRIFVQSVRSDLAVASADEAINRFCEGEGCSSDPVIDPAEERIERELLTIGDKQALKVLSKQEDTFILRYFIKNDENLYVFRVEAKDLMETKASSSLLEEAIESMEFVS
jgi:hypothetical protein